jgi:hypothetical protein
MHEREARGLLRLFDRRGFDVVVALVGGNRLGGP